MTQISQLDTNAKNISDENVVTLTWLGQAGFLIQFDSSRAVIIDPYLSDSLAKKYQGKLFPHVRMQQPPLTGATLPKLEAYLMTHGHTDHMDPETIQAVAQKQSPSFIFPKHESAKALDRGVPETLGVGMNAGDQIDFGTFAVTALPAAHEEIQVDEFGFYHALGYIIDIAGIRIYHSGDCVPYRGQAELLTAHQIDLALLPINGRDQYRTDNGVPGNFHAQEAIDLCEAAGIKTLIPHHFGMFDFNTVNPMDYAHLFAASQVEVLIPKIGQTIHFGKQGVVS